MDLFIIIIILLILAETTVLTLKTRQKPLLATNQKRKVYVDTSALMDPRLLAVAGTGFISDDLIIPRSVINELQLLADGKDHDKRLRARAGLDAVRELECVIYFNLEILDDALDHTPVDNRLLELAKANRGVILTNDFNLGKVAATDHIDVLNLNELALVLRNEYLPSEHATVKIVALGSNPHQGVGYLKDGTMVVVDQADRKLGTEVEIIFERLNQTASGTMMFAKLAQTKPVQTKPTQTKLAPVPRAAQPARPANKAVKTSKIKAKTLSSKSPKTARLPQKSRSNSSKTTARP